MVENQPKKRLGEILVQNGLITEEQLEIALKKQRETGELLGVTLMTLGFVDEESVFMPLLAGQLGVEFVNLRNINISREVIARIPAKFAIYYKVIPVEFQEDVLTVATSHPLDINIIDGISLIVPFKIKTVLASEKDIAEAVRKYYGVGAETIARMMDAVQPPDTVETKITDISEIDSEASIGKFINQILMEAYRQRATDIHIEPFENDLLVRYRVDGILRDAQVPGNLFHFKDSINSRIKIMSRLNIAEKRLPQDGRFQVRIGNTDLDLRVSFLPTQFGESTVIRILSSAKLYNMNELGLSAQEQTYLDRLVHKPHGIIYVTGPTGSGKTTTLYACLSRINKADRKIITIEDPIEYQLKGITQVQIHPVIGLTFARGLRSMLRHDPDIMMVGEVRDLETAEIAIQIALTGHLVFSTLHTNDAVSGITRLIDMGVEPYLISSAVECFIAQRLIRLICPRCKTEGKLTPDIIHDFGLTPQDTEGVVIYEGKGCNYCTNSGYYGREGIYEFLPLTEDIRELINTRASSGQIKKKALEQGMKTLLRHGWEKVRQGLTTPEEVIRVTKEEN